jgi:drug/metabolite transporter (DMT)-like permease
MCASFGTGLVAIQVGVQFFPPVTFSALRLAAAAAAFLILLAVTRRRVRWDLRTVSLVALLGVLSIGIPALSAAFAMRLVSSTLFSILLNLIPVFSVLLAHFLLPDEHLTRPVGIGVILAVTGASVVIWSSSGAAGEPGQARAVWLGVLLAVLCALSIAFSNILTRHLEGENTLHVTGGQVLTGLALILPLALATSGASGSVSATWQAWAAVCWSGLVGIFLGYLLSFSLIRRFGVMFTSTASAATPLFTALAGTILLREVITPLMAAGAVILIGGVLIVNAAPRGEVRLLGRRVP